MLNFMKDPFWKIKEIRFVILVLFYKFIDFDVSFIVLLQYHLQDPASSVTMYFLQSFIIVAQLLKPVIHVLILNYTHVSSFFNLPPCRWMYIMHAFIVKHRNDYLTLCVYD